MKKVFTGVAYGCVPLSLYVDGKDYLVQVKDDTSLPYTVIVPDEDKWISKTVDERKRRTDVAYTDEVTISEKLLRTMLRERIELLSVVINAITTSTEKRVRNEVARTLQQLLNP